MPRFNDIPEIEENLDGKGLRVAIAMARFNPDKIGRAHV